MIGNNVYGGSGGSSSTGGIAPINYLGIPAGDVTVPNVVTSLAASPFNQNTSVTTIKLPSSITAIANNAFYRCTNLTHIYGLENTSLTTVSQYAFSECTNLTSISLPPTVTAISDYAFSGCRKITNITIPASVTNIGSSAFSQNNTLKTVNFESATNLSVLGVSVFYGCGALTSVNLPTSIKSYPTSLFSGCSGLTSYTVPEGVVGLGNSAFLDCSGLKTISLPSTLTTVNAQSGSNYMTFQRCTGLETVNLAEGFNCTISFSSSTKLTNAAEMLTKLKDNTGSAVKTITFAKVVYDALTAEEIAVATNKNWTVASSSY